MEVSPGAPFDLDKAALTAVADHPDRASRLAVRDAEMADVLAVSGLLVQPSAAADALRLLAGTRPGRSSARWSVS